MNLYNKTIGIWGYGRVGRAAAQLCAQLGAQVIVYDAQPVAIKECPYSIAQSVDQLFKQAEYIIPSPGVDIALYKNKYSGIWLNELDLFQSFFHKKIIAITGSVGKTSVTHMLEQALKAAGWRVQAAGNIGTPMLSMIKKQNNFDAIVLEVSSFQLEHAQSFAPDLAIWTNLYPNHLDRHTTLKNYFDAKYQLLAHQTKQQHALIPIDLKKQIKSKQPQSSLHFFDPSEQPLYHPSGFASNWLIIEKALALLGVPFPEAITISPLEHRLEYVATIKNATFINDSKSTTPASTLAAIDSLHAPRLLLFLGGLGKGIDRAPLIKSLSGKSIELFCFGAESQALFEHCKNYNISASCHETMQSAVAHCMKIAQPNDTILFSPAGSSFDEFAHFEERGNQFKKMILSYKS